MQYCEHEFVGWLVISFFRLFFGSLRLTVFTFRKVQIWFAWTWHRCSTLQKLRHC